MERRPPGRLPVRVLAVGDFAPDAVEVIDHGDRHPPRLDEATIAARWDAHARDVGAQGRDPRNDELLRLAAAEPTPDGLSLVLGRTDYRQFVGTRTGPVPATPLRGDGLADPLGTSVVAVTVDGYVLVARRPPTADINPGRWFLVGGFLEPSDLARGAGLFAGAEREVCEELGLDAREVSGTRCTGLVYDEVVLHPELCFSSAVSLTLDEVRRRCGDGELSAIHGLPAGADDLTGWLGAEGASVVPTAAASILLHGRSRFGRSWYEDAAASVGGLG